MVNHKHTHLLISLLAVCALATLPAHGKGGVKAPAPAAEGSEIQSSTKIEQFDRWVDVAAISSQRTAIKKLAELHKKYKNTPREAPILFRLAQAYVQSAGISFRLEHGKAHMKQRALNLAQYRAEMTKAITAVNELLKKYPDFRDAGQALYIRGKAYEEIQDKPNARRDYLKVVHDYPELPEVLPAYMSLAGFAIEDNKHQEALGYLKEVEAVPGSAYYPFALYKSAWSHYNLGNYKMALSYLERHVTFYSNRIEKALQGRDPENTLENSELAIRENSLNDMCLFYVEAFEKGVSGMHPTKAIDYFRRFEKGPHLGAMLLRVAKILRSHGREAELLTWRQEVLENEGHRPETVDVVMTTFEFFIGHGRYHRLPELASDLVALQTRDRSGLTKEQKESLKESQLKARELLLSTGKQLQALTLKNKASTEVKKVSVPMVGVFEAFIKTVDARDTRAAGVHYNLAETLFEIGDYEASTAHYRWIVDNWGALRDKTAKGQELKFNNQKVTLAETRLKLISARYRQLHAQKKIPSRVEVMAYSENSHSSLDPFVEEWMAWLDEYRKTYKQLPAALAHSSDNFYFDANRTLYSAKRLESALRRLDEFARQNPGSKFAIPSASLVLDTFVKSENWVRLQELTGQYIKVGKWNDKDFDDKLEKLAANSAYKVLDQTAKAKEHEKALDLADAFLKRFPKSERTEDVLFLAGKAAGDIGEKERLESYFSQLITRFPNSPNTAAAHLARASQEEERFEFDRAAEDYGKYLAVYLLQANKEQKKIHELKRTILHQTWLSGDMAKLDRQIKTPTFCDNELSEDCNRYQALLAFEAATSVSQQTLMHQALEGPKANRAIWAAAALQSQAQMPFPDRLVLVRVLSGNFGNLDRLVQLVLLPKISASVPQAFALNRRDLTIHAKVRADAKSIKRRVDMIKEMEETSAQAMKLPWARIRAGVVQQVAGLYMDLVDNLNTLPVPKDLSEADATAYRETVMKLVMPFEDKGNEIARKAFEIASNYSIEDPEFTEIANFFFARNPSQAKSLRVPAHLKKLPALDTALLDKYDDEKAWNPIQSREASFYKDPSAYTKQRWHQAYQGKHWHQAAFFLREAKNRKWWSEDSLQLATAVTLVAEGARAEGLAVLEDYQSRLSTGSRKNELGVALIEYYVRSSAKTKVKDMIQDLEGDVVPGKILASADGDVDADWLAMGALWSGASLKNENLAAIFEQASQSSEPGLKEFSKKLWAEKNGPAPERKIASQPAAPAKVQ